MKERLQVIAFNVVIYAALAALIVWNRIPKPPKP